uniref:Uncharacterized protein n=1 Tax=Anopheles coluzzii TaxID=1518534 RepID=A0A6E8V204_ANOCL
MDLAVEMSTLKRRNRTKQRQQLHSEYDLHDPSASPMVTSQVEVAERCETTTLRTMKLTVTGPDQKLPAVRPGTPTLATFDECFEPDRDEAKELDAIDNELYEYFARLDWEEVASIPELEYDKKRLCLWEPIPLEDPATLEDPVPLEDPVLAEGPVPAEDPALPKDPVSLENSAPVKNPVPLPDLAPAKNPVPLPDSAPAKNPVPLPDSAPAKNPVPLPDPAPALNLALAEPEPPEYWEVYSETTEPVAPNGWIAYSRSLFFSCFSCALFFRGADQDEH